MDRAKQRGCDTWLGGGYCDTYLPDRMLVDEVTDEVFCPDHAGPLAWSARGVNMYSLALRVAGELDVPYVLPPDPSALREHMHVLADHLGGAA